MTDAFFGLIDRMNSASDDDRRLIEEEIWETFGEMKALLALDLSQFSVTVRRAGILPYLGLIRRMQVVTAPIVAQCRGNVVKYDADNLMAVFDDVPEAVEASILIQRALPGESCQGIACAAGIGIDFGRLLMIPGCDCYGDTVNIAYKLGEDLSRPGEILLTSAARERLGAAFAHPLIEQPLSVSGLELVTHSVNYQGTP